MLLDITSGQCCVSTNPHSTASRGIGMAVCGTLKAIELWSLRTMLRTTVFYFYDFFLSDSLRSEFTRTRIRVWTGKGVNNQLGRTGSWVHGIEVRGADLYGY